MSQFVSEPVLPSVGREWQGVIHRNFMDIGEYEGDEKMLDSLRNLAEIC